MTTGTGLPILATILVVCGCSQFVPGQPAPGLEPEPDVLAAGAALLPREQLQAITGAGEDLTAIPSMDAAFPVDDDNLAASAEPECRFLFAETATFGTDFTGFHKTTYQAPTARALISQAVALYPDRGAARRAFERLAAGMAACGVSPTAALVGNWTSGEDWLRTRPGDCGRDYRVAAAALIEVTFCGFPESVPEIVVANILRRVPG